MNVSYELTEADFGALIDRVRTSPKAFRLIPYFSLLMMCVVAVIGVMKLPNDTWPIVLAPLMLSAFVSVRAMRRGSKMNQRIASHLYGVRELSISDTGLTETRESGTTTLNWTSIDRIVRTKTHLFLYSAGLCQLFVPQRAFGSSIECDRFVAELVNRSRAELRSE